METKLKPCPFCGGEAELHNEECDGDQIRIVQCAMCGIGAAGNTTIETVTVWNRRCK